MAAEVDEGDLGEFEGRRIAAVKVVINNAGDGLSKAMDIAPQLLEYKDRVYVLLRVVTNKVRFEKHEPEKGEDDLDEMDRVQILRAEGAMIVPNDAGGAVDEMIRRVEAHEKAKREAKAGIMRLPGTEEDDGKPAKAATKRAAPRRRGNGAA